MRFYLKGEFIPEGNLLINERAMGEKLQADLVFETVLTTGSIALIRTGPYRKLAATVLTFNLSNGTICT